MSAPVLQINKVCTPRGKQFSLRIPQLTLHSGRVLCITGPNGSGKTTLLEHIVGLLPIALGSISILGTPISNDLRYVRACIGYIPDDDSWVIKELSAQEYFKVLAGIYQKAGVTSDTSQRVEEISNLLHFTASNVPLGKLSHGNKKKVQIIAALMHRPKLLVIDELRNGLDPLAIDAAEKLVASEATRGICVVAASHDLWWTERIADEVILLSQGEVILHRTVVDIKRLYGSIEQSFMALIAGKGAQ